MTEHHHKDLEQAERKSHFTELGRLLAKHLGLFQQKEEGVSSRPVSPPKPSSLKVLLFLKPIPWILTVFFLFSFFWDFNGVTTNAFGLVLSFEGLIRIISVSGLIGFLTNWIAITMLFRPLNKRPLLGQGLIPAHKNRIAARLAFAVSDDLINADLIKRKIGESEAISRYRELVVDHLTSAISRKQFKEDLKKWILQYITEVMQNSEFKSSVANHAANEIEKALEDKFLEKTALKTYSYFRGQKMNHVIEDVLTQLPVSAEQNMHIVDEFLDELPGQISSHAPRVDELATTILYRLINLLDVQTLVEENLREYDEKKLENMIRNATNEQLKTIQYLGAVLGTIGGFVIWQPLLSLGLLVTLFGIIYFLDHVLHN
ncbi:MAG: DUF445 family protein [Balneolaceae bacterium]